MLIHSIKPRSTPNIPSIKNILDYTRKLICVKSRWTQNALARDDKGYHVEPESLFACSLCLASAFSLASTKLKARTLERGDAWKRINQTIEHTHPKPPRRNSRHLDTVIEFNDHSDTTHRDVLNVLDQTIENLNQQETP